MRSSFAQLFCLSLVLWLMSSTEYCSSGDRWMGHHSTKPVFCFRARIRRQRCPCVYYNKTSATFHLPLVGDLLFKLNPGPESRPISTVISVRSNVKNPTMTRTRNARNLINTQQIPLEMNNPRHFLMCTINSHHVQPISDNTRSYHSPVPFTHPIPVLINNNQNNKRSRQQTNNIVQINRSNLITIPREPLPTFRNSHRPASFCLLNARSVKSKSFVIKDFVVDNDIDILAITETWLQANFSAQITVNEICPTGFFLHHLPRTGSRGGGVALLYKKRFKLKKLSPDATFNSFEFTDCLINYSSASLRVVVVYRPPTI